MRFALLGIILTVLLSMHMGARHLNAELLIKTPQDRAAFYRGEAVNLDLTLTNSSGQDLGQGRLVATLGGVQVGKVVVPSTAREAQLRSGLRIDTTYVRSGNHPLLIEWWVGDEAVLSASLNLTIARKPNPDRMTVWLWPHQAFIDTVEKFDESSREKLDWWASLGLSNFSFTLGSKHGDDARKFWDYSLTKGLTVCLQPEGGLTEVKLGSDDPDVHFRDPAGKYRTDAGTGTELVVANPFHPAVQRWQDEKNQRHMEVVRQYPQVTTAFFNTELIDSVARNANGAGNRLIAEQLGFSEGDIGSPQFVQPGVISDEDRGYRYSKFVFKRGNGLTFANQRTAEMIHRYRPDILTISDPYRSHALFDGFAGIDVLGSWTYLNPDPKYMLYVETLRAASRDGNKIPLSTVTLLNYPGDLAPNDRWMMMGWGRMTVATWINLSRAPKMLSYYFSSQCDPFGALQIDLKAPETKLNEFEMPRSTFEKLKELSEKVIQPYGGLIKKLDVAPRRIAVLSSQAARLYGTSPNPRLHYPNTHSLDFYVVLAMAQLPADIVFDETIQRFGLDDYDVLVLPKCDVLPQSVYESILAFQKRGGIVIADQYLGPQIPDVIRFDFDFTYRTKVSAMAIAKNQAYSNWDDHLKPGSAEVTQVQGVTALDDQRIMETYASELRKTLADRIPRRVDCDQPTALLNLLERNGVTYLFVINDKREYGPRLGEYKSILEKIVPQMVNVQLTDPDLAGAIAYDLLTRKPLTNRDGILSVSLNELGGTIIALYPAKLAQMKLNIAPTLSGGKASVLSVEILDEHGHAPPGDQPLKLAVVDPDGKSADISDYYCAERGVLRIPFVPAYNDRQGQWTVRVEDLTAGLSAETTFALSGTVQ